MMYGGGSSPPPPPDYSKQIAAERQRIEGQYGQQANAYNQAVSGYNSALNDARSTLSDLSSNIGGLSIQDINEDTASNFSNQLGSLESNLTGLSVNTPRPSFSSSVQHGTYGTIPLTPPSLSDPNMNLRQSLLGEVDTLDTRLNQLQRERRQEEQAVRDFRSSLLGDVNNFGVTIDQLGIGNETAINEAERNLAGLRSRAQGFSSPLLGQLYPDGFTEFDNRYTNYMDTIGDLRQQREQEAQRIADFEQNLLSSADQYRDQIGNLTIADADQISAIDQAIEDQLRQANRFESPLDYDFNNELSEVRGLSSRIDELQAQRAAEEQRIAQMQQQYRDQARAAQRAAADSGIYSAAGIQAIEDQLNDIRSGVTGFDSPLQADFSNVQSTLSEADAALQALRGRRQEAIGEIAGGINPAIEGLDDIPLSNESAIRDRLSQLSSVESELAPFSGGQVGEIQAQIDSARSQVNSRLQELADYRTQLEQQAQDLLSQVQDATYYGTDDLTGDQQSIEQLQAEADLYAAQQAMDEIDAIMNRLNGERQRLEADAEAVAARERQAQERIQRQLGAAGVPQFQNFAMVDPLTSSQFIRRFISPANEEEDEQRMVNDIANRGFSSALGVIRAG